MIDSKEKATDKLMRSRLFLQKAKEKKARQDKSKRVQHFAEACKHRSRSLRGASAAYRTAHKADTKQNLLQRLTRPGIVMRLP
jgi:hypothetical protein